TQYGCDVWAVMEWDCCIKSPEQGAREGAPFIQKHIIEATERAFDDVSGTEIDQNKLRNILGIYTTKYQLMKTISYLFVTALLLISCKQNTQKQSKEKSEPVAEQTQEKQSQDSWEILFDGSNFDAWHMYNTGEPVSDAWSIEDGAMVLTPGDLAGN